MTKIRNTKKGMAKKTLSISLAVAMLATSNVPVWAAEDLFTDGEVAVEAFTSDVEEAPVVEDAEAVDATSVLTNDDIDASSINLWDGNNSVKGKSIVYGKQITVSGNIVKKDGTGNLDSFNYGWRISGKETAFAQGTITNSETGYMWLNTIDYPEIAGENIELYIYKNDDNNYNIKNYVIATVKVEKDELSDAKLVLQNASPYYNGKVFGYSDVAKDSNVVNILGISWDNNDSVECTPEEVLKSFDVTTVQIGKNAGDKVIITATPKAGSIYTQTVTGVLTISARGWSSTEEALLVPELKNPVKAIYTGKPVSISTSDVTLLDKLTTPATALDNAIIDAKAVNANGGADAVNVGLHIVKATFDTSLVKNWTFGDKLTQNVYTKLTDDYSVEITERDLSTAGTTISIKHEIIPDGTTLGNLYKHLVFKGTEDGKPTLNLNVGTDYCYTSLKNAYGDPLNVGDVSLKLTTGTYTLEIGHAGKNTVNSQTITFQVGQVITGVATEKTFTAEYNGTAIEPTKNDFGKLTVSSERPDITIGTTDYDVVPGSYKNNINAATYNADGSIRTQASVDVKVKDTCATYPGEIFTLYFEIKPLTVLPEYVEVPDAVSHNAAYATAGEYKIPLVVTAKDSKGKNPKGLTENDYTVKYAFTDADAGNVIGNRVKSVLTITNPNFKGAKGKVTEVKLETTDKTTEIVAKALTDDMIKMNPSSYVYTGGAIIPTFIVMDGMRYLYDKAEYGEFGDYEVLGYKGVNAGTGEVTIKGVNNNYSGTATGKFEITAANTSAVKVEISNGNYTGKPVYPRKEDIKMTLNGNDVSKQFDIVGFGENIKAGKGTVTLRPNTKNFTGTDIVAEFNIVKETVAGTIAVYDENGANVTKDYLYTPGGTFKAFDFDGTAKEFFAEKLTLTKFNKATVEDFEIKYADNVAGNTTDRIDSAGNHYNVAYVYAVAKEGNGFTGEDKITLADGTEIKNVVAKMPFAIKNVKFVKENVTVKNGVYAGGLPVKPEVLVQIKGNTLVEGKDYELVLTNDTTDNHFVNPTIKNIFNVEVKGLGGYAGSTSGTIAWGIDKKDIKDCDVKVTNGVTTVMNGYIPVPVTEYTSTKNADGTYTVAAVKDSKNYVGSVTVKADGQTPDEKPEAPYIKYVNVVGNKATVILSGDSEGAVGYDYVISTDRDCITNKDYDKVNKNKLATETTFTYTQQGVYYAYCHAWKRDENGKKIFSDWSNPYPFAVSAITPDTPVITGYKVSGNTVTVTYTKAKNADGYDVVLGSEYATIADEKRPVKYGELVKKNIKGNTVTATFKNVPAGTYYAGLHAFNRTSEDGKKVFSPWSNIKTIKVK